MIFALITETQVGQVLIALLIAVVGRSLSRKTKEIHVLVNARMSDALKRIAQLEAALDLAEGEDVPAKVA